MRKLLRSLAFAAAMTQALEAATFVVTSAADTGAGTLRQAITDANALAGADEIDFAIPGTGPVTISLRNLLPDISDPIFIDGATQPGYAGTPLIVLSGELTRVTSIFKFTAGGNTIRALNVNRAGGGTSSEGIIFTGSGGNKVVGCWIGLDPTGTRKGNLRPAGIHIIDSPNNIIGGPSDSERNIISGNIVGVQIEGAAASGNVIQGNYIGTDPTGGINLGNFFSGVLVSNAPATRLGGSAPKEGNLISGNSPQITLTGPGASGNVIEGNWIGLSITGGPLTGGSGTGNGVTIDGAPNNVLGGVVPAARNIISYNNFALVITGVGATGNVVRGNFVGTDPTGKTAAPNGFGLRIAGGASGNILGGDQARMGNLVSGNGTSGITIADSSRNVVQGNLIGTDVTGNAPLPNGKADSSSSALTISGTTNPAEENLIGGNTPAARNVIAGNNDDGVVLLGPQVRKNSIQGNYIGLTVDGKKVLGNVSSGIAVLAANENLIGGSEVNVRNIIAGNGVLRQRPAVWLARLFGDFGDQPATNNRVLGNIIVANGGAAVVLLGANEVSRNVTQGNGGIEIDRGGDGPTLNIPGGASNYPEILSATFGSIDVTGVLRAKPNCVYRVQAYVTRSEPFENLLFVFGAEPLTKPIGEPFIVQTDEFGVGNFNEKIRVEAFTGDEVSITAYSIQCAGETSEHSPRHKVIDESKPAPELTIKEKSPESRTIEVAASKPVNFQCRENLNDALWVHLGLADLITLITDETTSKYVRAVENVTTTSVSGTILDQTGAPQAGVEVGLAMGSPTSVTDALGRFKLQNYPKGRSHFVLRKTVTITDSQSGQTKSYVHEVGTELDVVDTVEMQVKAELAKDEVLLTQLDCKCTPWCAIIATTINGVQKVSAVGGKNDFCIEYPEVTIKGPGGIERSFPAVPFPKRKGEVFSPAANGVWEVTSTVCGKTKTCKITLP